MTPNVELMFSQAIRLPQIPHVMQEVVKSLRNENVAVAELAALVGSDPVIAAKVLRLANSSYYGAMREVASIGSAVQILGFNIFRNLVIASAVSGAFPRVEGLDLPAFWRNSMLVGNLAQILGRDLGVDNEALFSAGLMHDIGRLLIHLCFPGPARAVAERLSGCDLGELRAIEQEALQMDRFEVGRELARRWNFPESIQLAIDRYDAPGADDLSAQAIHAAVRIAKGIQAGSMLSAMLADIPAQMASRLGLNKAWFEEQGEVFDLLLEESALLV